MESEIDSGKIKYIKWHDGIDRIPKKTTVNQPKRPPKPGVYTMVPEAEYHSWSAFNWSTIKMATPAHVRASLDSKPKHGSGQQELGSLIHLCMLEPELFHPNKVVEVERTHKYSKKGRLFTFKSDAEEWEWAREQEANEAKELGCEPRMVLPVGGLEVLKDALRPFYRNKCAAQILNSTPRRDKEVSIVWECPHTGLIMKARIDIVAALGCSKELGPGRWLGDIKSTKRLTEFGFARDVFYYDYHAQAAHYTEGWERCTGEKAMFFFVPVYKDPLVPEVQVRPMSEQFMDLGRTRWELACESVADAVASDTWPGRNEFEELQPPGSAIAMFSDGEELGGV